MQKVIRIFLYFLIGLTAWIFIFVKTNDVKNQEDFSYKLKERVLGPCSVPLRYSLGNIDSRFGISREVFLAEIQKAEAVWEEKAQKNLFEYKEDADFKINLIFDERQLGTQELKKLQEKFASVDNLQKNISSGYQKLIAEYDKKKKTYEKALKKYENDLEDYQDQVDYWNERGGAPKDEYEKLKDEQKDLEGQVKDLKKAQKEIDVLVKEINELVKKENNVVTDYNQEAETYKTRFGSSREFDQGLYTGKEINIYQFSEMADLELVLAHELGHYLGIEHLESPTSIMHYLIGEQDLENIQPTEEDIEAIESICQ